MSTAPFAGVLRGRALIGPLLAFLPLLLASKAPLGTPSVQFTAAAASASENAGSLTVTLVLSETSPVDVEVPFSVGGSATPNVDYTLESSPVTILAGQLTRDVALTLLDEGLYEADETVVLTLGTPTGAVLGATTEHTATVSNDDAPPAVSFAKALAAVNETAGQAIVDVELSAPSGLDVIVDFNLIGDATEGEDYTLAPNPLTIPAGAAFGQLVLTILDDTRVEGPEFAGIKIAPSIVGGVPGAILGHRAIIRDDESQRARRSTPPGQPALAFTADRSSIDFGAWRAPSSSTPETVVLTNPNPTDLELRDVLVSGFDPDDFTVAFAGALPIVVPPGGTTAIDVRFEPQEDGGPRTALLEVVQGPMTTQPRKIQVHGSAFGPTGAELVLNVGADQPYVDSQSRTWLPDYAGTSGLGMALASTSDPIAGTPDPTLYQTARTSADLRYAFELPNGAYDVVLHFAELEDLAPGQRVFEVRLEGTRTVAQLDLAAVAGVRTAYTTDPVRVPLTDGVLNFRLSASQGWALLSAIEVRSVPLVEAAPTTLDFGTIDEGEFLDIPVTLTNSGLQDAVVDLVSFVIPGEHHVAGHDFYIEVDGQLYYGAHTSVFHPVFLPIPAGGQVVLDVTFEPTEHEENTLTLRFEGNFDPLEVALTGVGANEGWGYLHPVITTVPDLAVDYAGDLEARVRLFGSESHTHEPGHALTAYDWSENSVVFASQPDPVRQFPIGASDIALTIYDDNNPAESATEFETIMVYPADAVPGILCSYYWSPTQTPVQLLDAVPAQANYIERIDTLQVLDQGGLIGGSNLANQAMVRWQGDFQVPQAGTYQFLPSGGTSRRLFVDGTAVTGPRALGVGPHDFEARFAVMNMGQLPLTMTLKIGGVLQPDFAQGVTHDENGVVPVIHDMPTLGTDLGGNLITITGFGFYPRGDVVVHWGGTDLDASDFTDDSAEKIEFYSPPGSGTIQVTVETPAGVSNVREFGYSPTGPVPIKFNRLDAEAISMSGPTCGAWGPDGRFYVGLISGEIKAITFDQDYHATSVATYTGVSNLTNFDLCGIAFNPWDPPSPVKIYVGHGEHWLNGGGPFVGESDYTGQVSILTGPSFDDPVPLVTRLPVSNHDHGINGLQFDDNGDLLIGVGGNTNAGVKYPQIGDLPESPLSGAVVKAHLSRPDFDGALSYVETATGIPNNDQVYGEVVDLAPGTDVDVYAAGTRNPYDIVFTTWNYVYGTDNGPNSGFGPASTGPSSDSGGSHPGDADELILLENGNYYGHPNRSRGRYDARQNVYRNTSSPSEAGVFSQKILTLQSSTDGICEYRAQTFNGQMRGELLVQKWNATPKRVQLSADKRSVVGSVDISPTTYGLDVEVGPGGAILTANYTGNKVEILSPDDLAAVALTVHDIHPWRAPATGGTPFVIGGAHFGNLGDTSVTIDGIPCTLTSVTSKRIKGILPVHPDPPTGLVDVTVQVGLDAQSLQAGFRFLLPPGQHPGFWRDGAAMPDPIGEVACGIVGSKMYLVGEGSTGTKTYAYDLLNKTWASNLAQRPFPGNHHGAEVVGNKWYLIGGLSSGQGKVQIYDTGSNSWSSGANMPWSGGSVATALISGKIYAAGGIVGSGTVANAAVYDPVANSWTALPALPIPVNHAAAATDGTRFWVFGGRQGGNFPQPGFDCVQVFDPQTSTWDASGVGGSTLTPMPEGRGGTGRAVYLNGEFYVMGGESNTEVFDEVFVYDPLGNSWHQAEPMPTPRHGVFPLLFQSRVFVAGGGTTFGFSQSDVLEIFARL